MTLGWDAAWAAWAVALQARRILETEKGPPEEEPGYRL